MTWLDELEITLRILATIRGAGRNADSTESDLLLEAIEVIEREIWIEKFYGKEVNCNAQENSKES